MLEQLQSDPIAETDIDTWWEMFFWDGSAKDQLSLSFQEAT